MPRVRRPQQEVFSRPLSAPSPVRMDVSSGTEAIARGLGQVSDAAARKAEADRQLAERTRQEQKRARLQESWIELGKVRQDIVSTARQQLGRDALEADLVNQTSTLLDQAAESIGETLPEDLRGDFAQIHRQHGLGLRDSVVDHVDREQQAYVEQQYKGAIETAQKLGIQGAVAARPGAGAFVPALAEARQSLLNAVSSQTRTWSPEAAEAEKTANLTGLHAGVVEALARAGRFQEAATYLQVARPEMDPLRAAALEKELAGPSQVAAALDVVQQLEGAEPDAEKRLAAVQRLQGPLAEKAAQIFREREAMREELAKDLERARFGRVTEAIEKGTIRTQSQLEQLLDFGQLTDEDRPRARKYLEDNTRANRTLAAAERAAQNSVDEAVLREYEVLIQNDLQSAAALDIKGTYAGRVSADGLNRLLARQGYAKRSWDKDRGVGEAEFRRYALDQVQGLPSLVSGKDDQVRYLGYLGRARGEWLADPKNAGKEPPREVVDRWVVDALEVLDLPLQKDKPRYQAPLGGRGRGPAAEQPYQQRRGAPRAAPAIAPVPSHGTPAPRRPPVPGAVHVTDGKQGAWLPPGTTMPQGWRAD